MPDETTPKTPPEDSGAGYGNNSETDDVGQPGEETDDTPEAHPS